VDYVALGLANVRRSATVVKPRLLDLFSGAGGAGMGYSLAGFDVTGVDNKPMPRYPFRFIQADALEYVAEHGHEYDAIHASPPCQAYTPLTALSPDKTYPDLMAATRTALVECEKPWVIENVPGSPLLHYITLCGVMFNGLRVYRHRRFETSFFMMQPEHPKHIALTATKRRRERWDAGWFISVTGDGPGSYTAGIAMGIDWMNGNELSQAIPPAYTRFIGAALMDPVTMRASA
jgi:DNA (cytosine-5)-methyltransferase 1